MTQRRQIDTRAGYDLWAESYDVTPNPVVAMDHRHALPLLDPQPGERVLDLGCGTGRHLTALERSGARAVGADYSLGMLRTARRTVPGARLLCADLQAPFPMPDRCVDAELCALVGEHLTHLGRTLREAHRVLRPGGRLAFTVYHPDLAAQGKEANFRRDGVEYRLGAVRYRTGDYLGRLTDAGFTGITWREYRADDDLIRAVPPAAPLLGTNVLLTVLARRPALS